MQATGLGYSPSVKLANKIPDTSPGNFPPKSPGHDPGASSHQPLGVWQWDIDLSDHSDVEVTKASPEGDAKGKERDDLTNAAPGLTIASSDDIVVTTDTDKSWRTWCTRQGLKSGDEDIELQPLLDEEGNISSKLAPFRRVLLDQALLMRARNDNQSYLNEAQRKAAGAAHELQEQQVEYQAAVASGAHNIVTELSGKVENRKRLAQEAEDDLDTERKNLTKTQKDVEDGQRLVVDMLKGTIAPQRLVGRGGLLAPRPVELVRVELPAGVVWNPPPLVFGAEGIPAQGPFQFALAEGAEVFEFAATGGQLARPGEGWQLAAGAGLGLAGLFIALYATNNANTDPVAFHLSFDQLVTACIVVSFVAAVIEKALIADRPFA